MSLYPYFGEFERILNEIYNYSLGISFEINNKKKEEKQLNSSVEQKRANRQSINNRLVDNSLTISKISNNEITIPIDKIIENLLIELPVPPRGIYRLEYSLNNHQKELSAESGQKEEAWRPVQKYSSRSRSR